jgi:hypothetical protein
MPNFELWHSCRQWAISPETLSSGIRQSHSEHFVFARTVGAEDYHLETNVHFASSGVYPIDGQEVFRGPSVGILPFLARYCVSFTTVVPQPHLWYLYWLFVQSMGFLHSLPYLLYFVSWGRHYACRNTSASGRRRLEYFIRPRRPSMGVEVFLYSFFNFGATCRWVVSAASRPLYSRDCPGTLCVGGSVSPRADLSSSVRHSTVAGTES